MTLCCRHARRGSSAAATTSSLIPLPRSQFARARRLLEKHKFAQAQELSASVLTAAAGVLPRWRAAAAYHSCAHARPRHTHRLPCIRDRQVAGGGAGAGVLPQDLHSGACLAACAPAGTARRWRDRAGGCAAAGPVAATLPSAGSLVAGAASNWTVHHGSRGAEGAIAYSVACASSACLAPTTSARTQHRHARVHPNVARPRPAARHAVR